MRYWDSSALVPLLVNEPAATRMSSFLEGDRQVATWWATLVECTSALARRRADGSLDETGHRIATDLLASLGVSWTEIPPSDSIREQAMRLVRLHRLRAADALQLAAAIVASDFEPSALEFVTLDSRQAEAAEREGFRVVA